jgi:hypothetical protein
MKNYIENWAKMILKESEEEIVDERYRDEVSSHDKEWDEPGEDFGRTYGSIRARGFAKKAWGSKGGYQTEEQYKEKKFVKDNMNCFVISGTKKDPMYHTKQYLYIKKGTDGNPASWFLVSKIDATIPFKSQAEAEKFIELFRDLPGYADERKTLGMLNDGHELEIIPMRDVARDKGLSESEAEDEKEETEQISENNDIPGKRYDWKPDFQFTNDVINDLKQRDLLELGKNIQVLLPVNRENGPTYYNNSEVEDRDENGNFIKRPATIHDNEVYDILHIQLNFDIDKKSIGIDRYYGHRADWVAGENATETHRDWSEVPVLTKSTVDSIIEAYKSHGVFEKLSKAIDDFVNKNIEAAVYRDGEPRDYPRYDFRGVDTRSQEDKDFDRMDKREMFKNKSQNPKFVQWLQRYVDRYQNTAYVKRLRRLCEEIQNGNVFNYTYDFFEPEIPDEEYNRSKFEKHNEEVRRITSELIRYYDEADRQGRNTGD